MIGRTPFYRTSYKLEHVHQLVIELKHTLFSASKERKSNIEPNRAFTIFTNLLIELTQTSLFCTSNTLERVHPLVIELEHPIFDFK